MSKDETIKLAIKSLLEVCLLTIAHLPPFLLTYLYSNDGYGLGIAMIVEKGASILILDYQVVQTGAKNIEIAVMENGVITVSYI